METPGLVPRLTEVLRPKEQRSEIRDQGTAGLQMNSGKARGKKEGAHK
jgi:hypothetical protein